MGWRIRSLKLLLSRSMLLTFKERFSDLILSGQKIHTVRADKKGRLTVGRKLEIWIGNPRNSRLNDKVAGDQVLRVYKLGTASVSRSLDISISFSSNLVQLSSPDKTVRTCLSTDEELNRFANNDGFRDWSDMKEWFGQDHFTGKLVYWTNFNSESPLIRRK